MTKVYPNGTVATPPTAFPPSIDGKKSSSSVVLTVWKKSLLFNCDGFTVFNDKGNLVFRVDNYSAGNKSEMVLMDASGKSLLTIRRTKRLSLGDNWLVFNEETTVNPILSARKHVNFPMVNTKCIAHVSSGDVGGGGGSWSSSSPIRSKKNGIRYEIEGSYAQRCCVVYDNRWRRVAEIRQKEATVEGVAFGTDVFRLIILDPEIDSAIAMAIVILLDQMFGSSNRFST